MYELLKKKLTEKFLLTDEQFETCKKYFEPRNIKKKQRFLKEGEVCRYSAFVEKGILRTYTIDEKGNEPILQFSMEGWWVADLYSFFTNEPSNYNIEAIENCELLLINYDNWENLLHDVPALERYFRILVQNNLIVTQRRLMCSMSVSAEDKYNNLLSSFPESATRVPQHMVASYLGISPETLSRIKHKKPKLLHVA